ncbi:MAG: hypothetical protein KDK04_03315 [Candidatus Competibacteraceae bacterium]|nr:hypothetical protein [Candidatus Competibacteraceae bacterium]
MSNNVPLKSSIAGISGYAEKPNGESGHQQHNPFGEGNRIRANVHADQSAAK